MPQRLSEADLREILPEIDTIEDSALRSAVIDIWTEIAAEMPWNDLHDVPKNIKSEASRRLIDHVRGVTQMAVAICEIAERLHRKAYDRDLLVAACLLHDASKPVEYEPNLDADVGSNGKPLPGRKGALGRNVQHAVYAAHKMLERKLPVELVNLVVTHTHGSNMRATTWEGAVLFYADFADTDAGLSEVGAKLYLERWHLGA